MLRGGCLSWKEENATPTYQKYYKPFVDPLLPEWADIAGMDALYEALGPEIPVYTLWHCPGCGFVFRSHETVLDIHQRIHMDHVCSMNRLVVKAKGPTNGWQVNPNVGRSVCLMGEV